MSERDHYACFLSPAREGMPDDPTPEESGAAVAHFEYLEQSLARGVVVFAGRTTDPPFTGIVVFEADNAGDAERFVKEDPGVRAGVFTARVQPFRVALIRGE